MTAFNQVPSRAHYGWDAPGIMKTMLAAGAAAIAAGVVIASVAPWAWAYVAGCVVSVAGAVPFLLGSMMVYYGLAGKRRVRDAMLDLLALRGNERVLDVGTGAGLLLIEAAKRLNRGGHAIGIDVWAAKDLSNNSIETTVRNIAIEGVSDRAEVDTADATALPFPDSGFDCVVSLLCLHNIEPEAERVRACQEIARVLKPGGAVVIGDYVPTGGYARSLAHSGLIIERSSPAFATAGSLMWLLVARKPVS